MRTLLTFAANETSKTVSVPTTDDSADEEDETFTPPLPASFEGMPGAHDGESSVHFPAAVQRGSGRRLPGAAP